MKTVNLLIILFLALPVLADPAPPAPTEAGVGAPEFQTCAECKAILNNNPINAQGQQLVINWDRVRSRYSFDSLPREDQMAILGHLGPEDRETLSERANRMNLNPKRPDSFDAKSSVTDNIGDRVAAATGMGNFRFKVGKKKLMFQYKRKF